METAEMNNWHNKNIIISNGDLTENRTQQVRIQLPLVDTGTQTEEGYGHLQPGMNSGHVINVENGNTLLQQQPFGREQPHSPQQHAQKTNMATESTCSQNTEDIQFKTEKSSSKRMVLLSKLSVYFIALRPWSFTASFTPVALGSCLAYKSHSVFDMNIFITTVFTALCVHAAGNIVNTYFDYFHGVDTKKSDDRTLVDSILRPNDVVTLGAILYVSGCLGFALLSLLSSAKMEHLALIYFCGLSSSFLYTGGLGLKYIAMGDILIVLTFGPLSVVFSYLTQTGQLSLVPLIYAVPLALNTEAILHCNNTRDMEGDRLAGAMTLAILLGKTGSYCLFCFLLFVPYILFITVGVHCSIWILLPAATIFVAFRLEKDFRRGNMKELPQRVAQLNLVMGSLYIFSLYFSNTNSLPSMTKLGG